MAHPALSQVQIIAHRGASHDAPENTLASARLGWEQGADAVEIDVRVSKDGHLVVIHDATTARTCGHDATTARTCGHDATTARTCGHDAPVADQTLEELQRLDAGQWKGARFQGEPVPTLAQVIALVPPGKQLVIEVKAGEEAVAPLLQAIRAASLPRSAFRLIAFSAPVLEALKRELPDVAMYWLHTLRPDSVTGDPPPTAAAFIAQALAAGFDGVNVLSAAAFDAAFVEQVHAANLKCLVWTVDDADDARRLRNAGVDAITTNRPGYLREALSHGAE